MRKEYQFELLYLVKVAAVIAERFHLPISH
jgi:hypothetical protein